MTRVLRTLLFAPGDHARRTEKALTLDADAVILDLEDACPVAKKIATRAVVVEALSRPRSCLGYIRVNPLSTEFGYGDIQVAVAPGVDGIVVPKIESTDELKTADWLVRQVEREKGLEIGAIDILPIIETGKGMAAVDAIARAGTRIRRLSFGAGDFTLDMDLAWTRAETEFAPYRAAVVLASRAAGLDAPLDTVWTRIEDKEGFAASCANVRGMGFGGKLCIYPDQIPVANAAFSPSEKQVAWARRVVEAFREAEATGSASIQLDGQFIDYPIVYQAQRVVAADETIANRHGAARRTEAA